MAAQYLEGPLTMRVPPKQFVLFANIFFLLLIVAGAFSCGGSSNSPAIVGGAGQQFIVVGHTTSSNFPVTNGSTYISGGTTGENGLLSALSGGGTSSLNFSTYLGGSSGGSGTQIRDVWLDSSGNIYVAGTTSAQNLPTTAGVFQRSYGGGPDDGFIAKYSPTGALLWLTYLGGSGSGIEEKVYAIAGTDSNGNLTVCGRTPSANFPVTAGAFQTVFGGAPTDAFVAKIKPDGSGIVAATFIGGNGGDANRGRCVLDPAGNVYGEGETNSTSFPTTPGAFQTANRSQQSPPAQGFVFKIASDLRSMLWSSYLGGSGSSNAGDAATGGIALGAGGNVYVAGYTNSSDLGATAGAFRTTKPSTVGANCYVAEIKSDGTAILALTYLGGSQPAGVQTFEECMALNLDSSGNVVVQGVTPYTNFPTTTGAYQSTFRGGNFDAFVAKLAPGLNTLVASTFIGGSGDETGDSSARIEFDSSGNLWTASTTASPDFPVTAGAYQSTYRGGAHDMVIFSLTSDLKNLNYGSYLGGNGDDFNRSFRLR